MILPTARKRTQSRDIFSLFVSQIAVQVLA